MKVLSIKNYALYQHYKDRRPPWVKLHASVLDDYAFTQLSDECKAHLMLLWILASQCDNKIPYDLAWIAKKIGATAPIDIDELIVRGFLEPYDPQTAQGKRENWPSRYVSEQTRAEVLRRCAGVCVACGADESLEIDHIIPISKGGTGALDNLQVLCRPCNRRKRARLQHAEAEQVRSKLLRRSNDSALLETETETEGEKEKERTSTRKPPRVADGPSFDVRPYLEAHQEHFPGSVPSAGRYAKAFKRLEALHGAAETLRRWRICLARKGTFATPEELSSHWPAYEQAAAPDSLEARAAALLAEEAAREADDAAWIERRRAVP